MEREANYKEARRNLGDQRSMLYTDCGGGYMLFKSYRSDTKNGEFHSMRIYHNNHN